jgi:hypothetical protein
MNSIFSNVNSTNTILGLINQLNAQLGRVDINLGHTLNAKYGILPSTQPTNIAFRYFGIGIGGTTSIYDEESGTLTWNPHVPLASNMDIFTPLPVRVLSASELLVANVASYRMLTKLDLDTEEDYYAFWLKVIDTDGSSILAEEVEADGTKSTYTFNTENFLPIPETPVGYSTLKRAAVSIVGSCLVSGEEVAEAVDRIHAGNMAKAQISEVGFYTGADKSTQHTISVNGQNFSYTEAVGVQLAIHRCMGAIDLSNIGTVVELPMVLTNGSSMLSGSYL